MFNFIVGTIIAVFAGLVFFKSILYLENRELRKPCKRCQGRGWTDK